MSCTSGNLSVLIPAYQHRDYIGAALDSIGAQSLAPFETVVVDDGSSDGTGEVVRRHPLPNLRLLRQDNQGAHAALNRAQREVTGDWLAILNSDDRLGARRLEEALAVARATGAGFVFGPVRAVDSAGSPLDADHPWRRWYAEARETAHGCETGTPLREALRVHNVAVTTSNFLVHRELWQELGGFRRWRWVHDLDFLLRALHRFPEVVHFVPDLDPVDYRVHGRNTISEDTEAALAERAEMLARVDGEAATRRPGLWSRVTRLWTKPPEPPAFSAPPRLRFPSAPDAERLPARVGIVTPSLDRGGLEEIVALLASGMQAAGATVEVATGRIGEVGARLRSEGVDVHPLTSTGPRDLDPDDLRDWLDALRPELVSTHFLGGRSTGLLADRGVRVVETVQNTFGWFDEEAWREERDRLARCAGPMAVSPLVAAALSGAGGDAAPPVPTVVIPNAVHPDRIARPPRLWARRRLGLPEDAIVFLSVGRISRHKNQSGIVDAFAEATRRGDRAILLLAGGEVGDGTAARIRRDHAQLLAEGRVRMIGERAQPGVPYAAADAYVAWPLFEGWSVAVSEAVYHGLPLVVGEAGGMAELVRLAPSGRTVPHPLGDPLAVTPEAIERSGRTRAGPGTPGFDALVAGLRQRIAAPPVPALPTPEARAFLDPSRLLEAYRNAFDLSASA